MSSPIPAVNSSGTASKSSEITDVFLKFAKMSPAERIRYQYLRQHNLTEESLAAMPPEKRKAIEKEIAEQIKEKLHKKEIAKSDHANRIDISV